MPDTTELPKLDYDVPEPDVLERRRAPRYPCRAEVRCRAVGGDGDATRVVRLRDISDTGVGLEIDRKPAVGELLVVELPGTDFDSPFVVCARVIHVTAQDDGLFAVGCAFRSELTPDVVNSLTNGNA